MESLLFSIFEIFIWTVFTVLNIFSAVLCSDTGKYDAYIKINLPQCSGTAEAIRFTIKKAQLDSEAISSSIGDNKSISFNFTSQVGGPEDTSAGLFILPPQE